MMTPTANANAHVQANANSQPSQMVEPADTPSSRRRRATTLNADDEAEAGDEDEDEDDSDDEDDDEEDEDEDDDDDAPVFMSMPPRQANANANANQQVRGMASVVYGGYASRYSRGPRHDLTGAPAGAGINWMFYSGKSPSLPDRVYIHQFHDYWWADYRRLEYEHSFIQWLFPVFESSGSEAKLMREDFDIATRVIRSYRLMLNFYGLRLVSEVTGEVARWPGIWRDRYDNLNWSGHNNLRITRILTSLGELGFQRYKKPLLDFLTKEITQNRQLPNCRSSLMGFWSKTLDYSSPSYKAKTKEDPDDREDSVFFRHMAENSAEYQKWVAEEAQELARREQGLDEAQRRDDDEELRRKERGEPEPESVSPWSTSLRYGGTGSRWAGRWQHEDEDDEEDEVSSTSSDGENAERVVSEDGGDDGSDDDDAGSEDIKGDDDGAEEEEEEEGKGKGKL
ncbi:opioid growth factor receptor (ogfr) region protein, putative [Acanthamoeba castellanii str. Neff]|uniref:Opioid growth factor receptor (Ogfr) region protein, putative n=1 Tax=Acanthamoeba castellanii (strain ATCC 30010 / Neff) TaxID=1257118 RepID=L8GW80_ACACF|nr:opioid growth factor receptor (ogfr) region protein, putative [Acanthamoeba castellanii str. Neff]ELR17172.1 opioid growth factor receptor (ogfr) region protein, putative [Acanthamoeba castellanii str. Neff]